MVARKLPAFGLTVLIYATNVVALSTLITGCDQIIPSKTLSQAKAEKMINKFLQSKGTISNFKGVVQNENESTAEASIEVSNYNYKYYDTDKTYSGPATASFTRYNDGTWAMTRFTITPPGNWLGTTWWDTNVKE
ncbi:MAG TPA: hypothetical protein DDW76_16835 [Cyanobacteria bacterium UBA11369]|nr:hypothetical protein [Cyanobacteria bacterium UBA11371]HBE29929.1 hypothetical protein [Cyanobacteria bacterium UBA11368]HBE50411.1 hypothetical protein [Cyanobacteria bacterium UBA11369]